MTSDEGLKIALSRLLSQLWRATSELWNEPQWLQKYRLQVSTDFMLWKV